MWSHPTSSKGLPSRKDNELFQKKPNGLGRTYRKDYLEDPDGFGFRNYFTYIVYFIQSVFFNKLSELT